MRKRANSGFTLIEILVASLAAAMILVAIYGIFQRAVKTRDHATERIRQVLQRQRAANILRNDLRGAYLSGGILANALEGGAQTQKSRFPGYLRFTTTTGRDRPDEAYGDVQQVEYYLAENDSIASDTSSSTDNTSADSNNTGILVRALTRDLLAPAPEAASEEKILTGVETFEITFYDGTNWQETWQVTEETPDLPQAVRIRIQQAASSDNIAAPTPLEIVVPLNTEPLNPSTTSTTGTSL